MDHLTDLHRLHDIPVHFEALLPCPAMPVGELMALSEGKVINTGRQAGETVEILAAGALIGFAELVDAGGRCAVRLVRFHAETD
jgi:flagellar motor switch/type III secretory pathway protein FliN